MADITITEGDTLEVDYSLENTGGGAGTFDPRLLVQGVQEDQDTGITLDPAQTATGTLQWPTESGDAVTDALAEAVTDDTSDSILVTVEDAIPDSGVARWKFEQDTTDSWGNFDGINNGGLFISDAAVGDYAINFVRTDSEYVGVSETVVSSFPFTFSTWVRTNNATNNLHSLTVSDSTRTDNVHGIGVRGGDASVFVTNGAFTSTGDVNVADGTYHLITGVIEENTITVYVNDGSGVSLSHQEGFGTPDRTDIGRSGDSTPRDYFSGDIDDARVYDKALTQSEVSSLYNTGSITQ